MDDPARLMAPLHVHLEDDEAWYVLEGTFRFRVGEHEIEAPRLGGLGTARRSAHVLESRPWPGALPARDDAEDARLIETLHDLPDRTPDTLEDHFRKYGCEIVE